MVFTQSPRVTIFSRAGDSEYRWLTDILREDWPVTPFLITNSNQGVFYEEVYRCSFGILYHSRNRGRVNITDVTDSLYDVEVKTMSEALGKDRVITVIDDLDDSSELAKERILVHQRSLKTLTRDVFLFTLEDKANKELLRRRVKSLRDAIHRRVGIAHIPDPFIPINVPVQDPDEAGPWMKGGYAATRQSQSSVSRKRTSGTPMERIRKILILVLSSIALWNTYTEGQILRNQGLVVVLWAAVTVRALCIHESRPVIPLISLGRFAFSSAITFFNVYDAYHRPNTINVVSSVLFITSWIRYLRPGSRRHLNGLICTPIPYALVLTTFWKGWQQTDAETTLQMVSQFLLRSPAILAAESI